MDQIQIGGRARGSDPLGSPDSEAALRGVWEGYRRGVEGEGGEIKERKGKKCDAEIVS